MNNSLPSEEIHDSHHSQSTRPWGNLVSSSVLLFRFPKAVWASLCLSHLHTLLSIRVHAFSFCVARQYASPVPLSDLMPAHTLALLLIADKDATFKVFSWGAVGEGRAAFLACCFQNLGSGAVAELVKNSFLLQIKICIWINFQQYRMVERRGKDIKTKIIMLTLCCLKYICNFFCGKRGQGRKY